MSELGISSVPCGLFITADFFPSHLRHNTEKCASDGEGDACSLFIVTNIFALYPRTGAYLWFLPSVIHIL